IIAVMGYTPGLEGEEGATLYEEDAGGGGDRVRIGLPGQQLEVLKKLHSLKKPVILVLTGGSPIELEWAAANIPAIVMSWYPGEQGGHAVADVLFGDHNPAGRLPVTFVKSLDQVPPFNDYNMKGRTYRFMTEEPLYPFGYGLSYTKFAYSNLLLDKTSMSKRSSVRVSVEVENTGQCDGDEVVQLYVSDVKASVPVPIRHLEGVQRIHLNVGEKMTVKFILKSDQLAAYDDNGHPFVEPGDFAISVGGGQPDQKCSGAVTATVTVK
ncbi:MAG: glycoside hydrolase family 3 C-terminal domain-containing protein, partial [bacterium]